MNCNRLNYLFLIKKNLIKVSLLCCLWQAAVSTSASTFYCNANNTSNYVWMGTNQNTIFESIEKIFVDSSQNRVTQRDFARPVFQLPFDTSTRMMIVANDNNRPEPVCGYIGRVREEDDTVIIPSVENLYPFSVDMLDACVTQGPFIGREVTSGDVICLPDTKNNLYIANSNSYNSISISTGHGQGDLDLFAKNGGWPSTDGSDPNSTRSGNNECIVITNPSEYWTYITVSGYKSKTSLVVDLGGTTCRTNNDPDVPPNRDNSGYPYNSVNILVYRFEFIDAYFNWINIESDLQKVYDYYKQQSYGRFTVTWDLSQPVITINESKSRYDRDFFAWRDLYESKIQDTGINPKNPGQRNIIMVTAPPVGNFNSSGAPPLMSIYHQSPGVVAHEIGHALGFRHAKALEAGPGRVIGNGDYYTEALNYGNVYSLMGMGAHTLEEFNLLYKSYFPDWINNRRVPLVNRSGTYRIYAFDHGTSSGSNAPSTIGLKLKSGNDKYTYWLEYRTTNTRYPNTKNGILINLEGYFEEYETDPRFWRTTSYLLDMTPGSKSPGWWGADQTDSELVIGKSYTDHWGGFRITPLRKGGVEDTAYAWIDVKVEIF